MSEKLTLKSLDARISEWEALTQGLSDELASLQADSAEQLNRTSARFDTIRANLESVLKQLNKNHEELTYIAHLVRRHEEVLDKLSSDLFCSKCFIWLYAGGFVLLSLFVLWRL